ncbi:hypothetical protein ACF07Y_46465 [Streptomyces sp. NPDC016566]|uniref:hypothetical protein n=1 Tax=Streptomyces sp. NPDC016566 TaxID=3364967 RepID=UPI0036FBEE63
MTEAQEPDGEPPPKTSAASKPSPSRSFWRKRKWQLNITSAVAVVSFALSGTALGLSVEAADEAWTTDKCVVVVAEVDRLAEIEAAAERGMSGDLPADEAGRLRAELIFHKAELEQERARAKRCLNDQDLDRTEKTLRVVDNALHVLDQLPALLPKTTESPSPSPSG